MSKHRAENVDKGDRRTVEQLQRETAKGSGRHPAGSRYVGGLARLGFGG